MSHDTVFSGQMRDWFSDASPEDAAPYKALVEVAKDRDSLSVIIDGGFGRPGMELFIEIDKGVPTVHISGEYNGDTHLHVRSAPQGVVLVTESDDPMSPAAADRYTCERPDGFLIPIRRPSPLMDAIWRGAVNDVRHILKAGADVNEPVPQKQGGDPVEAPDQSMHACRSRRSGRS